MSNTYIPSELRRLVVERANSVCEYCLIHEDDTYFGCQIDHIISEKHDGVTEASNLAYACTFCNRHKGSDIASIDPETGSLVRLFNPRLDRWRDHFHLQGVEILPLSAVGRVTTRILNLNHAERLLERQALQEQGRYPPPQTSAT